MTDEIGVWFFVVSFVVTAAHSTTGETWGPCVLVQYQATYQCSLTWVPRGHNLYDEVASTDISTGWSIEFWHHCVGLLIGSLGCISWEPSHSLRRDHVSGCGKCVYEGYRLNLDFLD